MGAHVQALQDCVQTSQDRAILDIMMVRPGGSAALPS